MASEQQPTGFRMSSFASFRASKQEEDDYGYGDMREDLQNLGPPSALVNKSPI